MDILLDSTAENNRLPQLTTSKRGAIYLWLEQFEYYYIPDISLKYTFLLQSDINFSKNIFENYMRQILVNNGFKNFELTSSIVDSGRTVNFEINDLVRL
jgi:hypothetical protein